MKARELSGFRLVRLFFSSHSQVHFPLLDIFENVQPKLEIFDFLSDCQQYASHGDRRGIMDIVSQYIFVTQGCFYLNNSV
jgi:hypothetical protein